MKIGEKATIEKTFSGMDIWEYINLSGDTNLNCQVSVIVPYGNVSLIRTAMVLPIILP